MACILASTSRGVRPMSQDVTEGQGTRLVSVARYGYSLFFTKHCVASSLVVASSSEGAGIKLDPSGLHSSFFLIPQNSHSPTPPIVGLYLYLPPTLFP